MKRIMLSVFAACLAMSAFAIAASQAWVTNYVAQAIASSRASIEATATVTKSNGITEYVLNTGSGQVRMTMEDATDAALIATNCTLAAQFWGVTNGCTFVWNGAGAYINPHGRVACTATNMVYRGVASTYSDGVLHFEEYFDAAAVLIQPSVSHSITNGMVEVAQ